MVFSSFDKLALVLFAIVIAVVFTTAANIDVTKPFHQFSQIAVGIEKATNDNNVLLAKYGGTGVNICGDGNILVWSSASNGWVCGEDYFSPGGTTVVLPSCSDGAVLKWSDASRMWVCGVDNATPTPSPLPTCGGDAILRWDAIQSKWICSTISSALPTCAGEAYLKWDTGTNRWICGTISTPPTSGPTKGIYTGWGQDSCAAGYNTLLSGYMFTAGQNNGYGGDFVCAKGNQGTVYIYTGSKYDWLSAPPCVVCSKDSSIGQCYTNWGDNSCASGFSSKYSGLIFGAGQNDGQWKTSLVCSEAVSSSRIYRYIGGSYQWTNPISCSVCCNDSSGGVFTKWGAFNASTAPACPTGYDTAYSGNMFQSGQRDGYGSNAVCGKAGTNTAVSKVYTYDGSSYKWGNVPCSVCAKSTSSNQCITSWGGTLSTIPSGYSLVYSGTMYSGGVNSGEGGGLACGNGISSAVYTYNPTDGYHWQTGACAVYCPSNGGQYTNWGSNSCAGGYTNVSSGYMYQSGQNDGMGGEFKCSAGVRTQLYIKSTISSGYSWVDAPSCATCVKASSQGECYTAFGTQTCASGYAAAYLGHILTSGVRGGHGQGTVCTADLFVGPSEQYTYYSNDYHWDASQPCAECCTK